MSKVIRLTESDLVELVKIVIEEQPSKIVKSQFISEKNKIPRNVPKISLGALIEILGNQGYYSNHEDEPTAKVELFIYAPWVSNPNDNSPEKFLIKFNNKWHHLVP